VNPVPLIAIEFTVTGCVPIAARITAWVEEVFTATLPNATLVAFTLSTGPPRFTWIEKVADTPLAAAVSTAVCGELTVAIVTVNVLLAAPCATVTVPGVTTAALLLVTEMATPPLGAALLMLTAQLTVVGPAIEELPHVNPVRAGTRGPPGVGDVPVPLRLIVVVPAEDELLVITS
jgi:hypothetical protein